MPIYTYKCIKCLHTQEELRKYKQRELFGICISCNSQTIYEISTTENKADIPIKMECSLERLVGPHQLVPATAYRYRGGDIRRNSSYV